MPLWHQGVRFAARKMPKVIQPTTHAVIDYAVAGTFLLMAARFWKRNRRAAMGSLICGGAAVANAIVTDYPGGVFRRMEYRTHGRIDAGLAALTASIPGFLEFEDEPEARFFGLQALAESTVTGLTDFDYYEANPVRRVGHPRAA